MPKLRARQIWLSLLVMALFAPVFLSTGSAAFRPHWLSATVGWMPVSVLGTLGLMAVFVALTWVFSMEAFEASGEDPRNEDDAR